jgi:hypothetical protein
LVSYIGSDFRSTLYGKWVSYKDAPRVMYIGFSISGGPFVHFIGPHFMFKFLNQCCVTNGLVTNGGGWCPKSHDVIGTQW